MGCKETTCITAVFAMAAKESLLLHLEHCLPSLLSDLRSAGLFHLLPLLSIIAALSFLSFLKAAITEIPAAFWWAQLGQQQVYLGGAWSQCQHEGTLSFLTQTSPAAPSLPIPEHTSTIHFLVSQKSCAGSPAKQQKLIISRLLNGSIFLYLKDRMFDYTSSPHLLNNIKEDLISTLRSLKVNVAYCLSVQSNFKQSWISIAKLFTAFCLHKTHSSLKTIIQSWMSEMFTNKLWEGDLSVIPQQILFWTAMLDISWCPSVLQWWRLAVKL